MAINLETPTIKLKKYLNKIKYVLFMVGDPITKKYKSLSIKVNENAIINIILIILMKKKDVISYFLFQLVQIMV